MNNQAAWQYAMAQCHDVKKHGHQIQHDTLAMIADLSHFSLNELYQNWQQPINFLLSQLDDLLQQYHAGKPLAYILKKIEFGDQEFFVDERVFIPRIETWELVSRTLEWIDDLKFAENLTIVEIGTGSGAIAISLALALPHAQIFATDISEPALAVAQKNCHDHHVSNVHLIAGNLFEPLLARKIKADVIICNPPYIANQDPDLAWEVKHFEPAIALYGGGQGLQMYEAIFKNYQSVTHAKSLLTFEMGFRQYEALKNLAKQFFPVATVEFGKDYRKLWRYLFVINL